VIAERSQRSFLVFSKLEGGSEFNWFGIRAILVDDQSTSRLRDNTDCFLGETSRKQQRLEVLSVTTEHPRCIPRGEPEPLLLIERRVMQ